jgi:hypothetical protein
MLPEGGHGDRGGGGRRGWRIRPPRALPRLASLGGEEVAVGSSVTTLEVLHENHRVGVCSTFFQIRGGVELDMFG